MTPDLPPAAPLPVPEKPAIAVLPFQNLSGDPEQEYFADGIVEDVITALSRNRAFFVISRNTTFTYKGPAVDVANAARELGVRYDEARRRLRRALDLDPNSVFGRFRRMAQPPVRQRCATGALPRRLAQGWLT
jgi:hypothetical protein